MNTHRNMRGSVLPVIAVIALVLALIALVFAAIALDSRDTVSQLRAETDALRESITEFDEAASALEARVDILEEELEVAKEAAISMGVTCDQRFPSGFYRLNTDTDYGAATGNYQIVHASVELSDWHVNIGARLSSLGIPTDVYFDYNGDGRIDTPLAARFVREIPLAGNSLADRILADSRMQQNLYAVFSCEWADAEFTSSEEMNDTVTGTPNMLWDLIQEQSASIVGWIREFAQSEG